MPRSEPTRFPRPPDLCVNGRTGQARGRYAFSTTTIPNLETPMKMKPSLTGEAFLSIARQAACTRPPATTSVNPAAGDADFAALQERGLQAMGVDQYTSTHRFDALADGGRIELQRDMDDPAGVRQIREHLWA